MKALKWILAIVVLLVIAFLLGPQPDAPELTIQPMELPQSLDRLEQYINERETNTPLLKPDNHARIVWANDSIKQKTPYSIVYLHGFSASQREGYPLHTAFAKRYGCNAYLARLYGHGIDSEEAFTDLTVENYMASAQEAIEIGKQLGEKVIVMSTSTGGTISLYLAAQSDDIHAIIAYSPNIKIANPTAPILTMPWGKQIAKLVAGDFREFSGPEGVKENWTTRYRVEAVITLQNMVEHTMTAQTFQKVTCPVFLGYYYKNETAQDQVVSVAAMQKMFQQLGTPDAQKTEVAFPEAGNHCIASDIHSKDLESVKTETFRFAENILDLQPVSEFQ